MNNSKRNTIPVSSWRMVSSLIVERGNQHQDNPSTSCVKVPNAPVHLPRNSDALLLAKLRTPITNKRPKAASSWNNTSSRQCDQMFEMLKKAHQKDETFEIVDPSYSVRKVVRGSGLLEEFGTGFLSKETPISQKEMPRTPLELEVPAYDLSSSEGQYFPPSPPSSPVVSPPNEEWQSGTNSTHNEYAVNEPSSDLIPLYGVYGKSDAPRYTVNDTSDDLSNEEPQPESEAPHASPYTSPEVFPQTAFFDRIVFHKTVETELVEYEVTDNGTPPSFASDNHAKQQRKRKRKRTQQSQAKKTESCRSGYDPSEDSGSSN